VADRLRHSSNDPDMPNMEVVPPAAPVGSADPAATVAAAQRAAPRGESILRGDEVDVGSERRPDHLLDPYSEARERQWKLGEYPGGTISGGFLGRAQGRMRAATRSLRDGAFAENLRDYKENLQDRLADLADQLQDSTARLSRNLQYRTGELRATARYRANDLRVRTEQFIEDRPAQAIAVAAGIGFALGVVLRLGKPRREY
jgi:ElaB/YqjD/DUF883 family membrane-anchored ribosome-binding protein